MFANISPGSTVEFRLVSRLPESFPVPMASAEQKTQIKAANDIIDVVSTYVPVVAAGRDFKCLCPFHNDTRPSLTLSRQYQNFRCWACDSRGDVFDFVMKFEKVDFGEALRMLAERAGIKLDTVANPQDEARGRLLRAMKWAEEKYRQCLLEDPAAEAARGYLGERELSGATVRQFGLGFAPLSGEWLGREADRDRVPMDVLVEVGLLAPRDEGRGFYDRFRDRVMFPIRDVRGQTVGFGGRILPSSPYAVRGPKYYNSAETPLFRKSELIYGLDSARHPASAAGFLALVEGYTDVMMAHQHGFPNVVATMGTALTLANVLQLRRYAGRVVLVFDGDEAGENATDKALELFWSQHDIDIAVTALPDGLDPCDLLQKPDGPDVFRKCLAEAQSVLDYKLDALFRKIPLTSAENSQRIVDTMLAVVATAPEMLSARHQIRQQSAITRIAHRLGLRQETLWARLAELKSERRKNERDKAPAYSPPKPAAKPTPEPGTVQQSPQSAALEKQMLQLLLAEPSLVDVLKPKLNLETLQHSGLRRMLAELYNLRDAGLPADLDGLRVRLLDRPDLLDAALKLREVGRFTTERPEQLAKILARMGQMIVEAETRSLKDSLGTPGSDEDSAMEVLRKLQGQKSSRP